MRARRRPRATEELRGSGDSEGLLWDEHTTQEQDDAIEVIAWLASQPWSIGAVGRGAMTVA